MSAGPLPPGPRALVRISGAAASRDRGRLEETLADAREHVEAWAVEEALVQSHLFVGFPAALEALSVWRELSGVPAGPGFEDDPGTRHARGARVCRRVYGSQYRALRENVAALHPDLDRWMVEEGYGKVLGRPGLELPERELCVVASLAVLGMPVQLYSHLRGALEVGVPPRWVEAALQEVERWIPPAERTMTWETWERVRARRNAGDAGKKG